MKDEVFDQFERQAAVNTFRRTCPPKLCFESNSWLASSHSSTTIAVSSVLYDQLRAVTYWQLGLERQGPVFVVPFSFDLPMCNRGYACENWVATAIFERTNQNSWSRGNGVQNAQRVARTTLWHEKHTLQSKRSYFSVAINLLLGLLFWASHDSHCIRNYSRRCLARRERRRPCCNR